MKNKLIVFAILALCLCMGTQAWATLLTNGDWEDPGTVGGHPAGEWGPVAVMVPWQWTGNESWIHSDCAAPPRYLDTIGAKIWADTATLWQEFPVTAGSPYEFGVEVFNPSTSEDCAGGGGTLVNQDAVVIAEWWTGPDGSGTLISAEEVARFVSLGGVTDVFTPISGVATAPAGATYARIVLTVENLGGGNGDANFDNAWVELANDPTRAIGGSPSEGVFVDPATSAVTFTPPTGTSTQTELYLAVGSDPNELDSSNFGGTATAVSSCSDNCGTLPVTLALGNEYIWLIETNVGGTPYQSEIWSFNTINTAPTAVASAEKNAWLNGGTVNVTLDGSASADADGYPGDPLAYTWTFVSGPVVVDPDDDVSPVVTLSTASATPYIFQLVVSDGLLPSAPDTCEVVVYAEGDDGLVAHWQFEDDLLDATGDSSLNGTASADLPAPVGNAVAYAADGRVGKALDLDGTNFVEIEGSELIEGSLGIADEITLAAWVRGTGGLGNFKGILTKGDSSWRIATDGSGNTAECAMGLYSDEDFVAIAATAPINDGSWHHVVGTNDGTKVRIYVDGLLSAEADTTQSPITQNELMTVRIGSNSENDATIADAEIDEVRIFNKGLSSALVAELFNSEGGGASCGGNYAASDFNLDCQTNEADFLLFVAEWLDCTDLTGVNCGN